MAYDLILAERCNDYLIGKQIEFRSMKMMGGLCYMVDEKMCFGIVKNQLMARIGNDKYQEALENKYCSEMNFTGRSMKGYVFIDSDGIVNDNDLSYWIDLCLAFNPFAKSSKKK